MCNARSYTLPIVFENAEIDHMLGAYRDLLVSQRIAHGYTTQDYTSAGDRHPVGTTRARNPLTS